VIFVHLHAVKRSVVCDPMSLFTSVTVLIYATSVSAFETDFGFLYRTYFQSYLLRAIFMKIGLSDGHSLREGAKEFTLPPLILVYRVRYNSVDISPRKVRWNFVKIGPIKVEPKNKIRMLCRCTRFAKLFGTDVDKNLYSDTEFREKRHKDGRIFLYVSTVR